MVVLQNPARLWLTSALEKTNFTPGLLVHLSSDVAVKGAVVEIIPPASVRVLWFHSGVQQTVQVCDKSSSVLPLCPPQEPMLVAREADS